MTGKNFALGPPISKLNVEGSHLIFIFRFFMVLLICETANNSEQLYEISLPGVLRRKNY